MSRNVKFCCQAPIAGEMCRSCQCTSDCGYFLPLLTSSCWKAHKWLLQNEGHNFSYFPFATASLFWQEKCFANNWFVIKVKSKQGSWCLFTRAKQKQHFDLMGTRPRCSTVIKEKLKKSFGGLAVWEEIRMKSWEPSLMIGCYIFFSLFFFRLKNSMLADEADNPGFLLLLEQVTLHSLNSVVWSIHHWRQRKKWEVEDPTLLQSI